MSSIPLAPDFTSINFALPTTMAVVITPEIAEQYLSAVAENHRTNAKSFNRLVTDMRNDNFLFTSDTLKVSTAQVLIDGAARLAAVIKSGKTVTMMLATGVNPGARHVVDTGKTFTLKNSLELNGVKHAGSVAAALTAIQAWERGDHLAEPDLFRGVTTNLTSLAFLDANPEVQQIAIEAAKLAAKIPTLTTKQLSAYIWAFDKLDRNARTVFFAKLVSGESIGADDPLYLLREILIRNESSLQKLSGRTVDALTIKAWNVYRAGHLTKTLTFVGGGSRPEDFPLPK
jgi:hypothetical protein